MAGRLMGCCCSRMLRTPHDASSIDGPPDGATARHWPTLAWPVEMSYMLLADPY